MHVKTLFPIDGQEYKTHSVLNVNKNNCNVLRIMPHKSKYKLTTIFPCPLQTDNVSIILQK